MLEVSVHNDVNSRESSVIQKDLITVQCFVFVILLGRCRLDISFTIKCVLHSQPVYYKRSCWNKKQCNLSPHVMKPANKTSGLRKGHITESNWAVWTLQRGTKEKCLPYHPEIASLNSLTLWGGGAYTLFTLIIGSLIGICELMYAKEGG